MNDKLLKYKELLNSNPKLFDNDDAALEIITDMEEIKAWVINRKEQLSEQEKPREWGEIGVVYDDPFIVILRDLVKFPSGRLGSYFRIVNTADLKGGQGTVVLPMVGDEILLLRHYRHSTRSWHWEVPRGFGEPNTPPQDNAIKEIREEIEGEIEKLVDLGSYHNNTGAEVNNVKLYFAHLSSTGQANVDEGIEKYKLVKISEFERMIRDAEITDGFTIAAYARAKLRKLI